MLHLNFEWVTEMEEDIVIVGYARTPFGSFQGSLASMPAPRLGAIAIKEALKRSGVSPEDVTEVVMGNVLNAGVGQAPARQAALYAGIPDSTPTVTVNKVCGSGMKALVQAVQSLRCGDNEVVVCGGTESMRHTPHHIKGGRERMRLGNQTLVDSMVHDGLWDPYNNKHMGLCAETCAREKNISREEQDAYASESFRRAQKAWEEGKFAAEVTSVEVKGRKESVIVDKDEGPSKVKFEKIPQLKPVFDKEGSITAANASTINDGACALVLMRASTAQERGLTPLAKIVSYGSHALDPEWFTTGPIDAMRKALQRASWEIDSVDLFEINEAFAVVPLVAQKELGIPSEKLNVWGGAISLGHPIGASGARIVMTLLSALKDQNKKRGVASICIGGGEGMAMCLETL